MLPPLNQQGDLPAGIHSATWQEMSDRFGKGSEARVRALERLKHLHELAVRTGKLARFLVFGSFVSNKTSPRDVDVVLIMTADFKLEEGPRESQTLFSHPDAEARYGASIFWLREGMLIGEAMESLWTPGRRDEMERNAELWRLNYDTK